MKAFVFTSDRYVDIVADQGFLLSRFCKTPIDVTVLGFNEPTVKYPENYKFESMGSQSDFPPKVWSEPIRPFIESIEENYFAYWWDDTFPICKLDEKLYKEAIKLVDSDAVEKVVFFMGSEKQRKTALPYNENFLQLSQFAEYRSSLEPAIFNKEYFLRNLGVNYTAWDYEVKNLDRTTNDGARILIPKNNPIIGWVNIFRKGKFNDWMWNNYKNSPTGHFAWNEFQKLDDVTAGVISKYVGTTR